MRRLGVFCFYDPDGIFYDSDKYLLGELRTVAGYLIAVVNGDIEKDSVSAISSLCDKLIVRENNGFDVCAYKEALESVEYDFSSFDELVLCNNSFFGPFEHFADIFTKMSAKKCDFWGLKFHDSNLKQFIESYFLVFRKPVLSTDSLKRYFTKNISNVDSYLTCCRVFELGLFEFLSNEQGFSYAAYSKYTDYNAIFCGDYELIDARLPILKRKFFTEYESNKRNIIRALNFVAQNTDYDISFILEKIANIQETTEVRYVNTAAVSLAELKRYISGKAVYVWGMGVFAGQIFDSLSLGSSPLFRGFIVSDNHYDTAEKEFHAQPVHKFSSISDRTAVIIIGMSEENTRQVVPCLIDFPYAVNLWRPLSVQTISRWGGVQQYSIARHPCQKYDFFGSALVEKERAA